MKIEEIYEVIDYCRHGSNAECDKGCNWPLFEAYLERYNANRDKKKEYRVTYTYSPFATTVLASSPDEAEELADEEFSTYSPGFSVDIEEI